jgi:hypothetical protein
VDRIYPRSTVTIKMRGVNWLTRVLTVPFPTVSMLSPGVNSTGSGVEGIPLPSASLSGSESGSSIEALASRLMATFDIGTAIEASSLFHDLFQSLFASEVGEGLDLLVAKIEMPTKGGGMKLWT